MSRASRPVILSPDEERAVRAEAIADAVETLRTTHPELFELRVSAEDPGVRCMLTRFGIDVTKEYLLEVLLRPHAKRICDSLAPAGRKEKPQDFMYSIVKDAFNKLNIDEEDLRKIGVVSGYNSVWTEETYIHKQIGYLREALGNLHKLKKWTKILADRKLGEEYNRREAARRAPVSAMEAARREEERRNREYKRILEEERVAAARAARNAKLAAHGKLPVPEGNLLGLHPAAAAPASAGGNLLNMNAARKAEIASNLEGLFSGGTRKQRQGKNRKSRKARQSQKSRRHSRK